MGEISYGRRLTELAAERGAQEALIHAADDGQDQSLSWEDLERRSNQVARLLSVAGVGPGDRVVLGLGNGPDHVYSTFGAWKLGASVLPLRRGLPAWERDRLFAIAEPRLVIGDWEDMPEGSLSTVDIDASVALDPAPPHEDAIPEHSRLVATSGSTGTPKIIVSPAPGVYDPESPIAQSFEDGWTVMAASPLYHTNGFSYCYPPLLRGNRVVVMEHFDAARAVDLIERYRVSQTTLVPTMLQRIAQLDGIRSRDLSSIEKIIYGGASLPEWAARTWLELIPPERFEFVYGGSEGIGATRCNGAEWLARPGTVGLPIGCQVVILDQDRQPLPAGEVGEIWMRRDDVEEPFRYIGTETPEPILDGYRTFGDMGRLDEDGFLYIADRRQDMIVTGGVNVFPAEVEAALSEHPRVADVVVVGLPDPEWGHRVHAIVQPKDSDPQFDEAELRAFCKARLSGPKVPKTFESVTQMPRTSAGKINRSRLVEERSGAAAQSPTGGQGMRL